MNKVYITVWSGGYDPPSYQAFRSREEAWKIAEEWAKDMDEGVDTIDIVSIDLTSMAMERLHER